MERHRVAAGESLIEVEFAGMAARMTAEFVTNAAAGAVRLEDIARLAAVDPLSLEMSARVELIEAWERVRAQVEGLQQSALASVIEATEAIGLDGEEARHEVGAALRLAPVTAHQRTNVAATLVRRLPNTLRDLKAGRIWYLQAREVAVAVADLGPDVDDSAVAGIEAKVLAVAPEQTVAQTRRTVARAVIAADPGSAQDRHEKAVRTRSVERRPLPDAMEGWWVTMPAPAAAAAWKELTDRARARQQQIRQQAGVDPGIDAVRVDTLVDALLGNGTSVVSPGADSAATTAAVVRAAGTSPSESSGRSGSSARPDSSADFDSSGRSGSPAQRPLRPLPKCSCGGAQTVGVVVDLPTLLGLADNPAELPGYGPVPPQVARDLAADRDWVRWTVDPGTRALIDRGAENYRPSDRLRAHVTAANRTCMFPGCCRPAEQCDIDHRITFTSGGRTVVINLGPLCRQHHNAKTHGGWKLIHRRRQSGRAGGDDGGSDRAVDHTVGHAGSHSGGRTNDLGIDYDDGELFWISPLGRRYPARTEPPLP